MNCILRKWRLSDAQDLAVVLNNEKILNNLRDGLPFSYTEQDAKNFIAAMLAAEENNTFAYAITIDDRAVGSIGAFRQSNIHQPYPVRRLSEKEIQGALRLMCFLLFLAPKGKRVAKRLKAIYAKESKVETCKKAKAVVAQLREVRLKEVAKKVEDSEEETLEDASLAD